MLKIAITGGIATGKSFVLSTIFNAKFPVISSDEEIAKMYQNSLILKEISNIFEKEVKNKDDVRLLALTNPIKRKKLEELLHKKLHQKFNQFEKSQRIKGFKICFFEIPLLFEKKTHLNYDYIIILQSPLFIRKRRFIKRGGSPLNFAKFNALQLLLEQKKHLSKNIKTIILKNQGNFLSLKAKVKKILPLVLNNKIEFKN
jgi:dephospho-CoA kinase